MISAVVAGSTPEAAREALSAATAATQPSPNRPVTPLRISVAYRMPIASRRNPAAAATSDARREPAASNAFSVAMPCRLSSIVAPKRPIDAISPEARGRHRRSQTRSMTGTASTQAASTLADSGSIHATAPITAAQPTSATHTAGM